MIYFGVFVFGLCYVAERVVSASKFTLIQNLIFKLYFASITMSILVAYFLGVIFGCLSAFIVLLLMKFYKKKKLHIVD